MTGGIWLELSAGSDDQVIVTEISLHSHSVQKSPKASVNETWWIFPIICNMVLIACILFNYYEPFGKHFGYYVFILLNNVTKYIFTYSCIEQHGCPNFANNIHICKIYMSVFEYFIRASYWVRLYLCDCEK